MKPFHYCKFVFLGLIMLGFLGCGGGGGGGGGGAGGAGGAGNTPADRWVLSGNNDATISLFRVDPVAGFANAVAFYDTGSAFGARDMVYDAANARILVLNRTEFRTLEFDAASGQIVEIDVRPTSDNSSHFVLNSAATTAYVASGTSNNQFVDVFPITGNGTLSAPTAVSLTVDPDYITLNPAGDRLYVVSRTDDQIVIFDVNGDGSLAANPTTISTDQNPTSLVFHTTGTVAYLTRSDNSQDSLQVLNVGTNGDLAPSGVVFDVDTNAIDMVLSENGDHLYVIEAGNREVHHFSADTASGALTFVNSINLSFNLTDLSLSSTGAELYVSHSEGDQISTLSVNASDGTLTLKGSARGFDNPNTVAAVGGLGALTPTATFLLTPDRTGLSKFSIGTDGLLTLVNKENTPNARISGEVAVQYAAGLLLGTGGNVSTNDLLTSYTFNPVSGDLAFVQSFDATAVNSESEFERIELGRSGRFMYILDEDLLQSSPAQFGFIRSYAYADDGSLTTTAIDTDGVGMAPENMTLHPAGRYIYSINSFGDNISIFEVEESTGTLSGRGTRTPGKTGPGNGRPIDLKFHPNGRFAFVSLQDDSQMVTYTLNENGGLDNPRRVTPPAINGTAAEPGPIAVHPNGKYVYVGEISSGNHIALYDVNQTDFSLTYRTRITTGDNTPPSWIEVDPSGQYLYVRVRGAVGEVRVFNIDPSTGTLTDTTQSEVVGNDAGFFPSMTLVTPLQ